MSPGPNSPAEPAIFIRRANPTDIDAVVALTRAAPNAAAWPATAYRAYCAAETDFQADRAKCLFVACLDSSAAAGAPRSSAIVGFAAGSLTSAGPCEIENILVADEFRRQGIGQRLLGILLLWCRSWMPGSATEALLWLEVRASNQVALAFYDRAGFRVTGGRRAYYGSGEDAILMSRPVAE